MNKTQTSTDGDFSPGSSSIPQMRSDPEFSCVSMKSHQSMAEPIEIKSEDTQSDLRPVTTEPVCKRMKFDQSENEPQNVNENMESDFSHNTDLTEVFITFKSNLRKKFECLYEGTSQQRNPTPLNEIYTELYITESESGEISNEHEVRQIETQSRRTATEDTPIKCNDIFKPLPEQDNPIRRVLTKGVAGIGKTVSVQKFILDWAEGKENQDVHLIFPLPFREINLMKNKTLSLLDLLHLFFPETKEMEISSGEYKVLFIFDGLDECRVSLDFHSSVKLCDVSESASVDVMLTNLMAGNLLPSSLIWITSRPAAADLIPSECVDRVTEVRGFTDKQKEEYFSKRISDESLNNRIKLNKCGITAEGCVALASALSSKTSCLTDLDLSVNVLQDSGVKLISAGLKNLHCKLKILRLSNCSVTKEGVVALAEALNSNPSHLTELHLQENHLKESDINLLSTIQDKVII